MPRSDQYDAVIVGAGPNGLSAGIVLAQAGLSVLIVEAKGSIGGGARRGWKAVAFADGAVRSQQRRAVQRDPAAAPRLATPSVSHGTLRAVRASPRDHGRKTLSHRSRARAVCRMCRALVPSARSRGVDIVRTRADSRGARHRVAVRTRRFGRDHPRPGRALPAPRWADHGQPSGSHDAGCAFIARGDFRCHTEATGRDCRR
ncbi:MAG: NAD(P)-binding protein [Thermoanaerobaculia bacterium]